MGTVLHRGQRYSLFTRKMTTSIAMPKTTKMANDRTSCVPFISGAGVRAKYQNAQPDMKSTNKARRIARQVVERRRCHSESTCASVSIDA
jgi:hypothetical protein